MDKRAKRGFIIFIACSLVIILIGIICGLNNWGATGSGGGRYGNGSLVELSGYQIIIAGIVMLLFACFLYRSENKEGDNH